MGNRVSALSEEAEELFGKIDFNASMKEGNISQNIRTALVKSDVPELQPDYLQKQLAVVKDDLTKSVKKLPVLRRKRIKRLPVFWTVWNSVWRI